MTLSFSEFVFKFIFKTEATSNLKLKEVSNKLQLKTNF